PVARMARPFSETTTPRTVMLLPADEVTTIPSEPAPLTLTALASTATAPEPLVAMMPALPAPVVVTVPPLLTCTSPTAATALMPGLLAPLVVTEPLMTTRGGGSASGCAPNPA